MDFVALSLGWLASSLTWSFSGLEFLKPLTLLPAPFLWYKLSPLIRSFTSYLKTQVHPSNSQVKGEARVPDNADNEEPSCSQYSSSSSLLLPQLKLLPMPVPEILFLSGDSSSFRPVTALCPKGFSHLPVNAKCKI